MAHALSSTARRRIEALMRHLVLGAGAAPLETAARFGHLSPRLRRRHSALLQACPGQRR